MSLLKEIESLQPLLAEEVGKLGSELIDFHAQKKGSRSILILLVDKPEGVTLDDCAKINRHLSLFLDGLEKQQGHPGSSVLSRLGSYALEVNSPGLDRPLVNEQDFLRVVGQAVRVTFRPNPETTRSVVGQVMPFDGDVLKIQSREHESLVEIEFCKIIRGIRQVSFREARNSKKY